MKVDRLASAVGTMADADVDAHVGHSLSLTTVDRFELTPLCFIYSDAGNIFSIKHIFLSPMAGTIILLYIQFTEYSFI